MNGEEYYIFTFGSGQLYEGRYVRIKGDYGTARQKMVDRYGLNWAFQYSEKEWADWLSRKPIWVPTETELEVIL